MHTLFCVSGEVIDFSDVINSALKQMLDLESYKPLTNHVLLLIV